MIGRQLPDSAMLDWSSAAPFVLVLRAMSNSVLHVWDGYQPLAIVVAPSTEFQVIGARRSDAPYLTGNGI